MNSIIPSKIIFTPISDSMLTSTSYDLPVLLFSVAPAVEDIQSCDATDNAQRLPPVHRCLAPQTRAIDSVPIWQPLATRTTTNMIRCQMVICMIQSAFS
jgi:hypothetical protein